MTPASSGRRVNSQRALIGRAGYYIRLAVSTGSDNEVYVANSSFHQSLDAGENFHEVRWGGDTHDIWIDPTNPDRFVITDDGGHDHHHGPWARLSSRHLAHRPDVPRRRRRPDSLLLLQQHAGRREHARPERAFRPREGGWDRHMGGCESGFTVPDTADPNVVWATCYGDTVTRWDARIQEAHSVSPWKHTLDSPPNELKYRCHWTPPLAVDPFDHNTVYYGCQVIFKTTDAGNSWSVVSPDLSTQDPAHLAPFGRNRRRQPRAILRRGRICHRALEDSEGAYLGRHQRRPGLVHERRGAQTGPTSPAHLTGLPPRGTITSIAPSSFRCRDRLRQRRSASRGQPRSVHLQDRRFRQDLEAHQSATCRSTRLSYVRTVTDDPNAARASVRRHRQRPVLLADDGGHWTPIAGRACRTRP